MKTSGGGASEESSKSSLSKVSKKASNKSRSKSTKLDTGRQSSAAGVAIASLPATPTHVNVVTTPTTPTTSLGAYNLFDASFAVVGGHNVEPSSNSSRSHHKSYAGFDPRSIKIFWEQHDQTDVELPQEVCARLAEDASYKVWELINNVKISSRHSGGIVTYDLVNEVLKDADVPPMLGAMDSDWDRIDYDGSYFFYSDKIFDLREEFQKDVLLSMPDSADFHCFCPVEDKNADQLKQFLQSLVSASIFGDVKAQATAIASAFQTPLMGACYRVIVGKIMQLLAFRQQDGVSQRCWRLLRACNYNPHANQIGCRQEYFHLAEVLISQLMAPYETIKVPEFKPQCTQEAANPTALTNVKMEIEDELKIESDLTNEAQAEQQYSNQGMPIDPQQQQQPQQAPSTSEANFAGAGPSSQEEQTIYKLQLDDDSDEVEQQEQDTQQLSPFFASPVGNAYVDELCETIGHLASQSGYLQSECLFLIKRRLARFFEGREVCSERDYKYISRAVRGLLALGEYAFREFIPYIYKLNVADIPESLWQDFAPAAIFLNGRDDIYLYEWLEYGLGADKLQPFLVHYARTYEKQVTKRYLLAKPAAYKIYAKPGVRRLEWSTLAAAMCHGDDPSKAIKPKPTLREAFPELSTPNLQLNCAGTIRFKFAGCRPVLLKPKGVAATHFMDSPSTNGGSDIVHSDILIARRKLFKPLTNVKRVVPISGYHYLRI
ncbi:uncharacterized protein LOC115631539 isoform X2 [Scaptodrosophila lebanonensis]|uniref:Uncharacterized protein LOC115631539 isoform X2 n=1 Tax=Drosophila lebanonensis TaxID=7225 RepID=A0A6J2UAI2_DROLE|nr:uncharacterized protein LOC115631539 isoform X2 [Scaptodrosophila lebanonensis]